jgi:hypothetical protein
MKTAIFTLLLFVLPFCIFSQDYQTFKSDQTHYFRSEISGNLLASEIIDTEIDGEDTIFYPFISIRRDVSWDLRDAPSWMGAKIIIREDGMNLFNNWENDTIFINTIAGIGESFTMYTFPSGATIDATVDDIIEETFYGITDSVKVISFNSLEPGFSLGDQQFRIGKELGLIDVFPFYSFPAAYNPIGGVSNEAVPKYSLVGQLYPTLGINKLTQQEQNNVNIGDVLSMKRFSGYHHEWHDRMSILDKEILGESVTYTIEVETKHDYSGTSEWDPATTTYSTDTVIETYTYSDAFVNWDLLIPEKNYALGSSDLVIGISYSEECGYIERRYSAHSGYLDDDGGYYYDPAYYDDADWNYSFGLGNNYHYFRFNDGHDSEENGKSLKGRLIGGLICGAGEFLDISEASSPSKITIYPNPAVDLITVKSEGMSSFRILNLQGQLVSSGAIQNNLQTISIVTLDKGMYFIEFSNATERVSTKFLKG